MPHDRDPVLYRDSGGRAVYRSRQAPKNLATRKQLRAADLSAAGLDPAAWLRYGMRDRNVCPLYERSAARPVRPITERQRAALAAGRTLVGTSVCARCTVARGPRREDGRALCPACARAVAADEQRRAWQEFFAAEEARERMLAEDRAAAAAWAREVLADPRAVVLDTETTGLDGSYAVSIAVLRVSDGAVLLDELLDPRVPIPAEATAIHGIDEARIAGAPVFAAVLPALTEALRGRRVVIYNAAFDTGVLRRELLRHHGAGDPGGRAEQLVDAWFAAAAGWECAMELYAQWWGTWHDYWRSYTWQPLGGGHDARSDCQAVIGRLWEMAGLPRGQLTIGQTDEDAPAVRETADA